MSADPLGSLVMDASERRAVIAALNNLAHYVEQGYPLEWTDPAPRGRKGRDRSAHRYISFKVLNVPAYDRIGWDLMPRSWRRGGFTRVLAAKTPYRFRRWSLSRRMRRLDVRPYWPPCVRTGPARSRPVQGHDDERRHLRGHEDFDLRSACQVM
jgi:hypothetical protein